MKKFKQFTIENPHREEITLEEFEKEEEIDSEYNLNEVLPLEGERKNFDKKFIIDKVLLVITIFFAVFMIFAYLYNALSPKPFILTKKPKIVLIPFLFTAVCYGYFLRKKIAYKQKKKLVEIIDSISGSKISIRAILNIYKPDHNNNKYIKQEVIARITDLLWEGYITEYKYVIDKKRLVRVKKSDDKLNEVKDENSKIETDEVPDEKISE